MALQAPSLLLQPWGLLSCSLTGPDPPEGLVTATVCPSPGSCRLASSLPTRHHTCTLGAPGSSGRGQGRNTCFLLIIPARPATSVPGS